VGKRYFVVDTSGRKYSREPLPKTRAEKQMKALHINTGHGMYGSGDAGSDEEIARIMADLAMEEEQQRPPPPPPPPTPPPPPRRRTPPPGPPRKGVKRQRGQGLHGPTSVFTDNFFHAVRRQPAQAISLFNFILTPAQQNLLNKYLHQVVGHSFQTLAQNPVDLFDAMNMLEHTFAEENKLPTGLIGFGAPVPMQYPQPLPPNPQQQLIDTLDALCNELDTGIAALMSDQTNIAAKRAFAQRVGMILDEHREITKEQIPAEVSEQTKNNVINRVVGYVANSMSFTEENIPMLIAVATALADALGQYADDLEGPVGGSRGGMRRIGPQVYYNPNPQPPPVAPPVVEPEIVYRTNPVLGRQRRQPVRPPPSFSGPRRQVPVVDSTTCIGETCGLFPGLFGMGSYTEPDTHILIGDSILGGVKTAQELKEARARMNAHSNAPPSQSATEEEIQAVLGESSSPPSSQPAAPPAPPAPPKRVVAPPAMPPRSDGKGKFIRRYLKGQGLPATKKNIDRICNIMDVEGIVYEGK